MHQYLTIKKKTAINAAAISRLRHKSGQLGTPRAARNVRHGLRIVLIARLGPISPIKTSLSDDIYTSRIVVSFSFNGCHHCTFACLFKIKSFLTREELGSQATFRWRGGGAYIVPLPNFRNNRRSEESEVAIEIS